jgi:hypothetical protein
MTEEEKKYRITRDSAVRCLARCGAKIGGITITTRKPVGLKQLAAIDCLVNHHDFRWVRETEKKKQEDSE